jgi:hypothetical protein
MPSGLNPKPAPLGSDFYYLKLLHILDIGKIHQVFGEYKFLGFHLQIGTLGKFVIFHYIAGFWGA